MHVHSAEEQPIVIEYFSRLQLREIFDSKSSTASSRLLSPESSLLPLARPLSSSLRRVQQVEREREIHSIIYKTNIIIIYYYYYIIIIFYYYLFLEQTFRKIRMKIFRYLFFKNIDTPRKKSVSRRTPASAPRITRITREVAIETITPLSGNRLAIIVMEKIRRRCWLCRSRTTRNWTIPWQRSITRTRCAFWWRSTRLIRSASTRRISTGSNSLMNGGTNAINHSARRRVNSMRTGNKEGGANIIRATIIPVFGAPLLGNRRADTAIAVSCSRRGTRINLKT